jgi:AcrR family transcriptional regulator
MSRISKEPAVRRKELIDIAQKLFITKGYEATSVKDILNEVNGAPGMFYYYFSSKEEIFKAAMVQYIDEYVTRINVILGDRLYSIPERIQNLLCLIRTTFDEYLFASNNHNSIESFGLDVMVSMRILNQIADSVENIIVEAIEIGLIRNSDIPSQKIKQLALFIIYGTYGILHDGSENGLSIEVIDRNMGSIIPLVSSFLGIKNEFLIRDGE